MSFQDEIAAALEVWFDPEYTEAVLYNGVGIQGHLSYGQQGKGQATAKHAVLTVKVADVPNPAYRDLVSVNGIEWRIFQDSSQEAIIRGDGYTWELPLIRDEKPRMF